MQKVKLPREWRKKISLPENGRDVLEPLVVLFCAYAFFHQLLLALVCLVGLFPFLRKRRRQRRQKKRHLGEERLFIDFLDSFSSRLDAGDSPVQAYQEVCRLLLVNRLATPGKESQDLLLRLCTLARRMDRGESFREAMSHLLKSEDNPEVKNYFFLLQMAMDQGASLRKLNSYYQRILRERREFRKDRDLKLISVKREQTFLMLMPFVLLFFMEELGIQAEDFNLVDWLVRVLALLLMGGAGVWSQRILDRLTTKRKGA